MSTPETTAVRSSANVSTPKKLLYGLGAFTENAMQNAVGNMANPFFNVALNVSPALLGIATSVFRLWDAVTDPIMGALSDRTESRFGRRRPYIVGGAVIGALLFVLMWWCPRGMSPTFYFGWYLGISLLFYTAFTVYGVPYVALGYELSNNYHDRTRVMSYRTWFQSVAGICIQWLFWLTQRDLFEDTVEGMRYVGIGMALLMLIMGVMPGIFLKEKPLTEVERIRNQQTVKLRNALSVFKVKEFRTILYCLLFSILGMFLVIIFGFYINLYYVFGGDLKAASTLVGFAGTFYHLCCMASIPLIAWTSGRLGKKKVLMIFMGIAVFANVIKWWTFTPANPWLQLVGTGLIAPGLSAIWTLLASMTADVTDLDELKNGTRREASFGAFYSWTMKLGFAFCFLVSGFILEGTGFDAALGGDQSESTLRSMMLLFTYVPAVGLLIAMVVIARYPLDETTADDVRRQLEKRS
jgi:glycoside/pentoside/hexuronide:cation symporter, GPH family